MCSNVYECDKVSKQSVRVSMYELFHAANLSRLPIGALGGGSEASKQAERSSRRSLQQRGSLKRAVEHGERISTV